jgi:transposase
MQKVKELFRLRFELKLSIRKIAKCLDISAGVVSDYLKRASKSALSWEDIKNIPHGDLANLLFPDDSDSNKYPGLTFEDVSLELKRKGVTRQLIWEEYQAEHPQVQLSYSQFCRDYRKWRKRRKPVLRHEYKAGERCQTDFCGPTIPITCPQTGVVKQAHIFVGVLCCSNYTFAKATSSQNLPDWIDAHISMLDHFRGSPEVVMIDNLKAGVDRACIPLTNWF